MKVCTGTVTKMDAKNLQGQTIQEKTRENPLGIDKIPQLLMRFSLPAMIGMMVNAFYNIVDRFFIGNAKDLGANGLAGITIGFPIMIILLSIGILFGVGGATLFSIKLGSKKEEEAQAVLENAFAFLVISGFLFMVFGQIFLKPLLQVFGASEAVLPFATKYMRVIFFGAIFQVVGLGMNNFLRADGKPNLAMITMFVGAGINIVLDPILIFGFKMGMEGAALATIFSQAISLTWILAYFFNKKNKYHIQIKKIRIRFSILKSIVGFGIPGCLMQVSGSILNAILNRYLWTYGGDVAVSGMGIINSIQTIIYMPIIGLNQGIQPIISYNFGAKKYNRIKEAEKLAMIVATLIVSIGWIATRFFAVQMVGFFNRDSQLLEFGSHAVQIWFLCLPITGFQMLGANFFQATGRPKVAMFLTLTRQGLFLIPFILLFSHYWGLSGILIAVPIADVVATVITGIWFYFGIRMRSINETV